MIKNKRVVIIIAIVLLLILNVFLVFKKDTSVIEKSKINKIERKEFNIYLQQSVGSEEYDSSSSESFPSQGYLLNANKTMCYDYNGKAIEYKPEQNLVNEVIDGSITIESNNTIYCNLYFDKNEEPIISKFEVTGKTSDNKELNNKYTYQTDSLPFNVTYTDNENDVKQYCISETEGSDNCIWKTLSGTSGNYTLTNKDDGQKTMYIYLKDKANNISEVKQDTITVDRTAPVVTTFTLTGTADTGQSLSNPSTYTHKKEIKYSASITEKNMEGYCIYEGSNSCNYINNTSTTITNQSYTINDTEGSHSVIIKVKDKAGNESVVDTNSTKTITLDKINPIISLNKKSTTEDTIVVTVIATDEGSSGIKSVTCTATGNGGTKTTTYNSNAKTCTFSSLKDNTSYSITGVATDESGRINRSSTIIVATEKSLTDGQKKAQEVLGVVPRGISEKLLGGMYRFVGTKDTVDNWICFGYSETNATDCNSPSSESMYRIIGITEDGQLKIIKNKSFTSSWASEDSIRNENGGLIYNVLGTWINIRSGLSSTSSKDLDKEIPNYSSKKWNQMLEYNNLLYGEVGIYNGIQTENLTANQMYDVETGKVDVQSGYQKYKAGLYKWTNRLSDRVWLMYPSDFLYSYSFNNDLDSSNTRCIYSKPCSDSWLLLSNSLVDTSSIIEGGSEWTMTAYGYDDTYWYIPVEITGNGFVTGTQMRSVRNARPVYYLSSANVKINEGSGTTSSPFIVIPTS